MRALLALTFFLAFNAANAPHPAGLVSSESIVLIPIDSRPAAGQFPQMIAAMADVEVRQPPAQLLGHFTKPGDPEAILHWLEREDLSRATAIIASTDMVAYGGLIESRLNRVTQDLALKRLNRFVKIRQKWPHLKIYGFSAVMRITPTATKAASPWRMSIAKLEELRNYFRTTEDRKVLAHIEALKLKVPPDELASYRNARRRDHEVQRKLVRMTGKGDFDYTLIGQDDARPYGPHVPETSQLGELIRKVGAQHVVNFCEGIDQHANVLVSRALLRSVGWTPKVRVVYADERGKNVFAHFESKPLWQSLNDQVVASGAMPVKRGEDADFTLYVNTPGRNAISFASFQKALEEEVDQGLPVAVADVNLTSGTSDTELINALSKNDRIMRILSFAGWNTAGNTMGTAIPAATVYLLARRTQVNGLKREVAQREFLLHRFVNDYAYHRFTRPAAYTLADLHSESTREEAYGNAYAEINDFVKRDLTKHLNRYFRDQFYGRKIFSGTRSYVFSGLDGVRVTLPWPRAYEVKLEFKLVTQEQTP